MVLSQKSKQNKKDNKAKILGVVVRTCNVPLGKWPQENQKAKTLLSQRVSELV